ncbi:MAG: glucose-1-phosphate thymidylyltransferase [Anaerolineae bacterium]|nr:glucose-1-phosphate thymidylyltransferase [Anaerolineae bacterium]MDW8173652.1 glucose-1-phosphate thymidylyltransferase [Anaerolineae bacterium]
MKGLILSGGKGTRLYPLTYTRAKQLIPVANKPVLVRVIEAIRSAGVEEIGIVVGETAPEIKEALGNGQAWDVKLTYIHQVSPDGLAHAVKISRDFLQDEPFVMFLGDNVIQGGIGELIRSFAASDWNSQIVLKEVDNPSAYGVAKLRPDGSIEQLIEKPKDPPSNLALVGIYMFDHHVFEAVEAIKPSKRGELEITDAIQWLVERGYRVYPHIHQGWWIDTGKPTDMLEANAHVLEEVVPSLDPSAQIDEQSQVDKRVTVQAGARIVRSVVRGPAIIGMNAVIEDAYIGPFTSIYHDVTVRDAQIERCIILEKSEVVGLGRGMILRDSLIGRHARVGRSTELPMGVKLNLGDYSNILI